MATKLIKYYVLLRKDKFVDWYMCNADESIKELRNQRDKMKKLLVDSEFKIVYQQIIMETIK